MVGRFIAPTVPFKENYFLEDSKKFREVLDLPLVYVGGAISRRGIDEIMDAGFEMVQIARALIRDTDFVKKLREEENHCSTCKQVNFCVGRMYTLSMQCHALCKDITPALKRDCEKRYSK
jgi:2,4-dienoyl-CoA reductase-like NADH-dependent reductase (Old Yellow Enzyme family)